MTEPSGDSSKPRRPVAVPIVALLAITALGITALLGGLNERPDPAPPQLKLGQVLDQGQFDTVFVESKVTFQPAENEFAKDKRFVDVVFKVTNKTDRTVSVGGLPSVKDKSKGFSFGSTLLKVTPEIKSQYGPELFVLSKGVQSSQLQPGIQATVIARYELEGAAQPPKQLSYDVGAFELLTNPLDDGSNWFLKSEQGALDDTSEEEVVAKITLPVKAQEA
ncbi:MAG: hypothetical protein HOV96_31670 [Nonomuraea sp.]|nr:hypothetical protein [Nonomuraea sp.]NUP66524.1 hypothetical protein [Nonomuraea sp.]NUP82107.1 hypothetical protein [Nonomuraea sp.]NUT12519.1 hypothetical protein [Nonomuraea sp.]